MIRAKHDSHSIDLNVADRNILQKHPHNTGIDKALGGSGSIFIDKHGHTGFAWTKDKLGMYRGEARLGDKPIVY